MPPTTRGSDRETPDYEQLRDHLARPRLEHPAPRPRHGAPLAQPEPAPRVSVMAWLLVMGRAVTRRLRRAPRSAMVRLHPPE
jgi:hypothetical protein